MTPDTTELTRVGVIGAGRMGRGIALAFAYAGMPVTLVDLKSRDAEDYEELARKTAEDLYNDLECMADNETSGLDRVQLVAKLVTLLPAEQALDILSDTYLVFEAVPEIIAAKKEAFCWLDEIVPENALIASTTSSISVNALAEFVTQPARFLNTHWLNPAHLIPLVEISRGEITSDSTVVAVRNILSAIGKVPVVCRASPGYIVPRIQAMAMNEAARLVEEGVASAEDVDTAVRVGFGLRFTVLGLLEFIDWGGGDILYYACNYLAENIDKERFAPANIIKQHMQNNLNGLRDGAGFYDYQGVDIEAYRKQKLSDFIGMLRHLDLMPGIDIDQKN
ncbi:3-hydroxybutyryl-CoA dehydrogenase [Kineobactrum salinum]|uniref:L-gulonate 3-dehydrogenase n=1 Tax=Kineobactrum salinum TaxID=2708301 RepID=A0A6C0U327_9GAMM|nr:3-hydroxybutyryl-CoA dehydrogenase [Kineobactrum salinum]QIB66501.1 3-hydroxybutyryl-CoA dehydrogenase [Kineobactrum salinum]